MVAVLAQLLLFLFQMKASKQQKKGRAMMRTDKRAGNPMVTINGIVIPIEWDEIGNIVAIALSAYDEKEYIIDKRGKGIELINHLREEVEISGVVSQVENNQMITVTKYVINKETGSKKRLESGRMSIQEM